MQLWTITELMYLTRDELCELVDQLQHNLIDYEAESAQRVLTLASLHNIRRVALLRNLHL